MSDYARSDVDRSLVKLMSSGMAIGRPLYAPPAVPPARVAALRKAFDDIMRDPEFVAEAKKPMPISARCRAASCRRWRPRWCEPRLTSLPSCTRCCSEDG